MATCSCTAAAGSRALVQHDLVDELRLMVFPVVLGSGRKLFEGGAGPLALRLVEARQAGEVALLVLRQEI
jgi:dihydrofolate reductase